MSQTQPPKSKASESDASSEAMQAEIKTAQSDDEKVQLTPTLVTIAIAALILGIVTGLIMSFTATGHG